MKDDTPDFKYEYMNDIKKCIIINIFNNYLRYEEKIYTIVDDRIENIFPDIAFQKQKQKEKYQNLSPQEIE